MSVWVFTCAKGSPGTTTTALAVTLSWPRPVLLVEADPAGGDLTAGWLAHPAPPAGTGLLAVLTALRRQPAGVDLTALSTPLDPGGGRRVLAGLHDPAQTGLLTASWPALLPLLAAARWEGQRVDVLIDLGRLPHPPGPAGLLTTAEQVLLVLRPALPQIAAARTRAAALAPLAGTGRDPASRDRAGREGAEPGRGVGVVCVGDGPYPPAKAAEAIGAALTGVIGWDPGAAGMLAGEPGSARRLARSLLLRSARTLATHLAATEPALASSPLEEPAPGLERLPEPGVDAPPSAFAGLEGV